jgi:hypothetical protein
MGAGTAGLTCGATGSTGSAGAAMGRRVSDGLRPRADVDDRSTRSDMMTDSVKEKEKRGKPERQ